MFGSIKGLPRFHNYQDAVEFVQTTKGIRGRTHIIPLKLNRRDPDSYRIEAETDGGGNIRAVHCWLYRTPVLTYTPNQLIINAFSSMTTNQFINEISPYWLQAYMKDGQKFMVRGEGEFLPMENGKVVINVDKDYEPVKGKVQAAELLKIVLNKTRAAESRKQCKGVVELARVTSKIDGYWQALVESKDIAPDEDTAWFKGILKNGSYRMQETWRGGYYHYFDGGYPKDSAAELLPRLKAFIYQRQYDHDECYDYSPAEYGVVPKMWSRVENVR